MEQNLFFVISHRLLTQKRYLKDNANDCFKTNDKQIIKMPKEDKIVGFKNYKRKIKSPFMICADFEIIGIRG